ncbi:MAG TPA: YceI family protein [Dongiaceae bacterium]|nr:YceI family protein [Dongiaceae bacterium]
MSEIIGSTRAGVPNSIARSGRIVRCTAALVAFVALAIGAADPAFAADKLLTLDPAGCTLTFMLDTTFHEVHGTMKVTGGTIRFNPSTGAASGEITVDATSAETGNGRRDKTMHRDILESGRFPKIVFKVERVEGTLPASTPGDLKLHGVMTLHGANHPVTLPASVRIEAGVARAEAHLSVPYVEWGLADPSFLFVRAAKLVEVSIVAQGRLTEVPDHGGAQLGGRGRFAR